MHNTEIKTYSDNPAVAAAFAADFCDWVSSQPAEKETLTVALSGGSTPKLLFEELAANYSEKIDWKRIHFFWGDERCVPADDAESNYGVAKSLLLNKIEIPAPNVHRVRGEAPPADERVRYEQEIIGFVKKNEHGVPAFDLILLGMGGDGHTASIFPHQIELLDSPNVCEVATHPDSGQQRITLTGKVLRAGSRIAYLITGSGKAEVLAEVMQQRGDWKSYPVSHIENAGPMQLYLDDSAAAKIR